MKIDVIVPQYGCIDKTLIFLESFAKYRVDGMGLIIVDNGTPEKERDAVFGRARLLPVPVVTVPLPNNYGFVKATNVGLGISDADVMILQNNDTEVYKESYTHLIGALMSHPSIGIAGPVTSDNSELQSIRQLSKNIPPVTALKSHDMADHVSLSRRLAEKCKTVLYRTSVSFFCAAIKKEVIRRVGYLSTDFGIGLGDDDDYCARAAKAGFRIVLALGSYVRHDHHATFKRLYTDDQYKAMKAKNRELLKKKHPELGL